MILKQPWLNLIKKKKQKKKNKEILKQFLFSEI